jgi:carboxylesterase
MGGAIATLLATDTPGVSSLVLLAPYFRMDPAPALVGRLHWFTAPFIPYLRSRNEGSIRDAEARRHALGAGITSPRLLHELDALVRRARQRLSAVTAPTLVIHSRHDPRIGAADAEQAFGLLRTPSRSLQWLDRSAHVVSVDHDRDAVFTLVAEWLERGTVAHRSEG